MALAAALLLPALSHAQTRLPDAPEPQPGMQSEEAAAAGTADAQQAPRDAPAASSAPAQYQKSTQPGFPPVSPERRTRRSGRQVRDAEIPSQPGDCLPNMSNQEPPRLCCARPSDAFQNFVDSAYLHPLSPRQKGYLAFRNAVDPFNLATIVFISGLNTASDPHSAYGPGFPGFGRNVGVAYTETAVGEFFGTFLIPAVSHQDPHYHRLPNAPVSRRIFHAIEQVAWTESDYGLGMPNYSNLVGTAVTDTLGDLYVPGRKQGFGAGAARWSLAVATSPISNFITEFLPDVARRVNIRIVLVQQVINQIQRTNGGE